MTSGTMGFPSHVFNSSLTHVLWHWILCASVVQCEISNAPIRVHNHMTPHMVHFGKVNKHSYSALLGQAHKVAQTECGLRLARRVLEQVKKIDPKKLITQEQVGAIIKCGDSL